MNLPHGRAGLSLQLTVLAIFLFCMSCRLLQAQSSPGGQSPHALFAAIQRNDTNTAFQLLDKDTNLVHASLMGRFPLHVAAQKGTVSIVARLLRSGADINQQGDSLDTGNAHLTALDIAIWYNQPEVVRLLLDTGANPNLLSYHDGSALHLAILYNHPEMAASLLEHGANPFLENQFPYNHATPIDMAIDHGNGNLVLQMLNLKTHFDKTKTLTNPPPSQFISRATRIKSASDVLAERGSKWLTLAAAHGELEVVNALLKAGVVTPNAPGQPPMMHSFALAEAAAEQAGNFERDRWLKIRDQLIGHGADYDAFAVTAMSDLERAQKMVATNRNAAQLRDQDGQTPLHWAVRANRLPMASFWIQSGAPLAATNNSGQTALHLAAIGGKSDFINVLLVAHAPTDILDTNGWTPLDAAIQAKQTDSIHLLLADKSGSAHPERGFATPLHEAAAAGNIAALVSLLETSTNLEARNELGLTPLQVAVGKGHLASAALLVDKGADLNVRDPNGNALLHQIFLMEQFTVHDRPPTNWLTGARANPNKEAFIRYLAVGPYEQGPNPVIQGTSFLLACGLDARATNNAGQTVTQLITAGDVGRGVFFFEDDREKLLKLLSDAGGVLEQRDAQGNTILHRSVNHVDANSVDRLADIIASGADINATNNLGQTPLHRAAERIGGWDHNNPPVHEPFQLLLYRKANVNAQDNAGATPLHVLAASATSFRSEATRALIDAGANPNLRDNHGRTPAHLFLSGKWPWNDAAQCLDILARAGADLAARDDTGKTPLHYLASMGSQSPMFFLRGAAATFTAAKVDFNARDLDGNTPLHTAAKTGTRDVFDWLAQHGAGLDETNNARETPRLLLAHQPNRLPQAGLSEAEVDIFAAAREGKTDALASLINADPKLVNATNRFGQSPLREAVTARQTNAVAFLDHHGAQWDVVSAVMAGQADVLRELLSKQPAAIATNSYWGSLLHLAAINGNVETTRTLLDTKADIQAQDPHGLSPLGVARLRNQPAIAEILRQSGAVENIFDVAYLGGYTNADALLKRDKKLAIATNSSGFSVLEIAAGTGQADLVKLLLNNGASPRMVDERTGRTPLHLAATYNRTNTAQLLIQHGSKVNATNRSGFTPLHLAAVSGATEAAELLLKDHAIPSEPTSATDRSPQAAMPMTMGRTDSTELNAETALHLAALMGRTNIVKLLLAAGASANATDALGRTPLDMTKLASEPPTAFWIQTVLGRSDPLGIAAPPSFADRSASLQRQKIAAELIEKAGGKGRAPTP